MRLEYEVCTREGKKCPRCNGTGRVSYSVSDIWSNDSVQEDCTCRGLRGESYEYKVLLLPLAVKILFATLWILDVLAVLLLLGMAIDNSSQFYYGGWAEVRKFFLNPIVVIILGLFVGFPWVRQTCWSHAHERKGQARLKKMSDKSCAT